MRCYSLKKSENVQNWLVLLTKEIIGLFYFIFQMFYYFFCSLFLCEYIKENMTHFFVVSKLI